MSAKFPRGGGGAGPFLARSLHDFPLPAQAQENPKQTIVKKNYEKETKES